MPERRRFPVPWRPVEIPGGWRVVDATGHEIVNIYGNEGMDWASRAHAFMSRDEARRLAAAIARVPQQEAMRRYLEERKTTLAGCIEGSEEERELIAISEALGE